VSIFDSFLDRSEDQRLAERSRLRLAIASHQLKVRQLRELQAEIAAIDAAADLAADAHQTTTAPIQSELAGIARQQAADMVAGKKEDTTLEARRRELLDDLAAANEVLESAIDKSKRAKKYIAPELTEVTAQVTGGAALEGSLMRTAPLSVQCESWAAKRGLKFATERLTAAGQGHRTALYELRQAEAEPKRYDLIQFHRRELQWRCELKSAGAMVAAARSEHDDCQRRLTED
jgi:hypothetical protein